MLRIVSRILLAVTGWKTTQGPPPEDKYVVVAAPHTSNWDLVYMVAVGAVFGIRFSFIAKHSLFWPPLGWLLRALGAIPIDRRRPQNMVEQMAEAFENADRLILAVPPEGTRGRAEYWKSGFYRIAEAAGVPIVLSVLDYGRHEAGFGPVIRPKGDIRADMDRVRAFYADKTGRYPDRFGPVRLRAEEVAEVESGSC